MRFKELLQETRLNGLTVISLNKFVKDGYRGDDDEDENIDDFNLVTEADDFGLGASYHTLDNPEMQDWMKRIISKHNLPNKEKYKAKDADKFTMPYLHNKLIKIVDEGGGEYDLDDLRDKITQRPNEILKYNRKMQHTEKLTGDKYFNIGLPALRGLAVNEETGEFVVVDTCPGAGICKTYCYAKKGSYVVYKDSNMAQTRVLNFLLNDPEGFAEVVKSEIRIAKMKNERRASKDGKAVKVVIRWHDSGDFFSPQYLSVAYDIARAFPDNTFYAYTKMSHVALEDKPENFVINFSEGALPKEEKKIDFTQIKNSRVVPKELFKDLIEKGEGDDDQYYWVSDEAWEKFKHALANKYKIDPETIITAEELMTKPDSKKPYWNVVVPPGGTDVSANKHNVLGSYLMFH